MLKSEFVPQITVDDMAHIISFMRQADVDELWAANRFTPREAVFQAVEISDLRRCVKIGGVPVAICGIAPFKDHHDSWGVPWLLGTDDIAGDPIWFLQGSKQALNEGLLRYRYLINFVDARNVVSLNWLRWLGFEIHPAEAYGPDQLPFHRVTREA